MLNKLFPMAQISHHFSLNFGLICEYTTKQNLRCHWFCSCYLCHSNIMIQMQIGWPNEIQSNYELSNRVTPHGPPFLRTTHIYMCVCVCVCVCIEYIFDKRHVGTRIARNMLRLLAIIIIIIIIMFNITRYFCALSEPTKIIEALKKENKFP